MYQLRTPAFSADRKNDGENDRKKEKDSLGSEPSGSLFV
jgi:hypothetical protein